LSGLVDPDEGIHVEVAEIDLERGVVTVRYIEEESGEVVDIVEIGGLGNSFGELLDAMEADPAWAPLVGPLLEDMADVDDWGGGFQTGLAWFSVDGVSWEPIIDVGPLQGMNRFESIVATEDGFVATSDDCCWPPNDPVQNVLWHSVDGTTWTEGAGLAESHLTSRSLTSQVLDRGGLNVWAGQPVAAASAGVWTIEDSPLQLIPARAVSGMGLVFGELGIVGLMFGNMEGHSAEEIFFSVYGSTWNRWDPPEFDPEDGMLKVVGMGDDFFVVRLGGTTWVGTLP
jgi:hypothetical protein